jgi:PncC family amidohydrolase
MITDTPGSSGYFLGGVVAYKDYVKTKVLKVKKEVIKKYGAISVETARAMSGGVAKLMKSDVGIGITGIAGPGGAVR